MGPGPGIAAWLPEGPHTGTGEAGGSDPECTRLDRPAESLAWTLGSLSEKVYLLRTYCVQGTDSGTRRSASDEQMWSLP